MSIELFKTDNISIIGEYQKKPVFNGLETKTGEQEYIKLIFTIHINGKLKTFSHYIKLARKEVGESKGLEDYYGWYMLYDTLCVLGYEIGKYDEDTGTGGNIIDKWIEECIKANNDKETFYR